MYYRLSSRVLALSILAIIMVGTAGCATKAAGSKEFEKSVDTVKTVDEAIALWGNPDAEIVQADGMYRRTWIVYSESATLGHTRKLPNIPSTEFVDPEWESYVHGTSYQYFCYVYAIGKDKNSPVTIRWKGNSCDRLLDRSQDGYRNLLPK